MGRDIITKGKRYLRNSSGNRILPILISFILISGCQFSDYIKERRITRNNQQILMNAIHSDLSESVLSPRFASIIDNRYSLNSLALVYIVDGGCSACIADFLGFVKCFSSMDSLNILGIVHEETIALVQYYSSMLSEKENSRFDVIPVNNEIYSVITDGMDNVFLVTDSHLYKSFIYYDGYLFE